MTSTWNTRPADFALPAHWPLDEDTREHLEDYCWSLLVRGESDADYYLDAVTEEVPDIDEEEAHAVVEKLIDGRRRQLAELGDPPASRLSEAFAELETIGVIAREDFSCCTTCAHDEIRDERAKLPGARGFVYYHEQDTERLIEDRSTYLGYGTFLGAESETLSNAEKQATYERVTVRLMRDEVVPVLRRHGIGVEWSGDLGARILLTDVDYFAAI
ncbi:hypothetical protein [Corynebacterium sp.]|uniref:DUF6891 domain-containing protein n=1 Tax=Corynebacterium sp. TaxID=1720 RepID=UPI0019C30AEA|nr:hypothetical protein [Corynebacterium sp.]HHU67351.1 hypothetical protein [Corynebacterium sp.]